MTCIVAYRVPGEGAVLSCDSRVTDESAIVTDTCDKWLICGNVLLGISGHDGGLMPTIAPARSWADVVRLSAEYSRGRELEWEILAYDRRADRLMSLDHHGTQLVLGNAAAAGHGAAYALGALDVLPRARSLDKAAALATKAVRVAIRRDTSCGGRVRTFVARGRSRAVEPA